MIALALISILAGPARERLHEFLELNPGLSMMWGLTVVAGYQTRAVHCECTPAEALEVMLRGTPLRPVWFAENWVTIFHDDCLAGDCCPWLEAYEAPLPPCEPRPLRIHGSQ